jgi:hypothetical protein
MVRKAIPRRKDRALPSGVIGRGETRTRRKRPSPSNTSAVSKMAGKMVAKDQR